MKKNLNKLRIEIDSVDKKLLKLLSKRASLAKDVGQTKNDGVIYRPEREAQILSALTALNEGPLSKEGVIDIFKSIISNCRALEKKISVSDEKNWFGGKGTGNVPSGQSGPTQTTLEEEHL